MKYDLLFFEELSLELASENRRTSGNKECKILY